MSPGLTDLNRQLVTVPLTGEDRPPGAVSAAGSDGFMIVHGTLQPGLISSAGPDSAEPMVTEPWAWAADGSRATAITAVAIHTLLSREPLRLTVAILVPSFRRFSLRNARIGA
jgi:hypothetical protein